MGETCTICQRGHCGREGGFEHPLYCYLSGYEREKARADAANSKLAATDVERLQALSALAAAQGWIDKHKCCTEERQALVAKIDEALDAGARLRTPVVREIPSADAEATHRTVCRCGKSQDGIIWEHRKEECVRREVAP